MKIIKTRIITIVLFTIILLQISYIVVFFGFIYTKAKKGELNSETFINLIDNNKQEVIKKDENDFFSHLVLNKASIIYYPVDKDTPLPYNYVPEVVTANSVQGTPVIDLRIYTDLVEMFNEMKVTGLTPQVVSGYRSYESQIATFDQWVNYEMTLGNSRQQAEANVSTYSAKPGYSEHQLGTAVDITDSTCTLFDRSCQANWTIWNWLSQNAFKYGFAISYPEGKDAVTGYIYEAWHYRWVGHELATEFKSRTDGIVLRDFLEEKKLY